MKKTQKPITQCKYGLFVHFVAPSVIYSDGSIPTDIHAMIDRFDAECFINQVADMGVEYLLLTAWHFKALPLYPSPVTDKWRTLKSPRRDLLGEIIDGLTARGVQIILYTHPRDGHDFDDEDRLSTGWGLSGQPYNPSSPNSENFNRALWNTYIRELYTELAEKYGGRISGFYTDGIGPRDPWSTRDASASYQVVDYLMIRDIMKSANPDIVMYQNYFGDLFSTDCANTEEYSGYIKHLEYKHVEKWEAATIATSITAFLGSWGVTRSSVYGEYAPFMTPEEMAKFTMFAASCSVSGGVAWASGPFAEGNIWPVGVVESLRDTGKILAQFKDSLMDAVCSKSYPTISGDSLESRNYCFWMTDAEEQYEYLHCMRMPEDGVLTWGQPEDEITLKDPVVVHGDMQVQAFHKTEEGYTLQLIGTADALDTVIRFRRSGTSRRPVYEWVNDTDKRIDYRDGWGYSHQTIHSDLATGCYERDFHFANDKTFLTFAFNGSILEIYGILDKDLGNADVYIDGIFCGTIYQNAEKRQSRICCFRSLNLHGGWHVLQLHTKGNGTFRLDAFKVLG